MHHTKLFAALLALLIAAGCGSQYAGTYSVEARPIAGKPGSTEPGYSLAEIQQKLRDRAPSLSLAAGGRYTYNTGSTIEEGAWRIEEDTLHLRADITGGTHIQPALRKDRKWKLGSDGSLVNTSTYSHYGVKEVWTKQ